MRDAAMMLEIIASLVVVFVYFKFIKPFLERPRKIPESALMPVEPQGYCAHCGSKEVLFLNGYDRHTGQPLTRWDCPKC